MSAKPRSQSRASQSLAARRRRVRRRAAIAFCILLAAAALAIVYALWRPALRITEVEVFGTALPLEEIALRSMEGSYAGIAPRNSTFLIPDAKIRAEILAAHPTIAAVSLFRKGFTGLTIKATDRAPIARWCSIKNQVSGGVHVEASGEGECYVFDASGVIFAPASSTTPAINAFVLYAPLENNASEPLRAKLENAAKLPPTFDFARAVAGFGAPATRVVVSDDEVHVHLESGTRLTYVLGHEQTAYAALVSAKEHLDLSDGSLEYVDLRFEGRVYLKRKASSEQETVNSAG